MQTLPEPVSKEDFIMQHTKHQMELIKENYEYMKNSCIKSLTVCESQRTHKSYIIITTQKGRYGISYISKDDSFKIWSNYGERLQESKQKSIVFSSIADLCVALTYCDIDNLFAGLYEKYNGYGNSIALRPVFTVGRGVQEFRPEPTKYWSDYYVG